MHLSHTIACWGLLLVLPHLSSAESITPQTHYRIQGLSGSLSQLVETRLKKIDPYPEESIQHRLIRSDKAIQQVLEAHGYFRPHIQSEINKTATGYHVTYTISHGPPLLITTLSLQLTGEGQWDPILTKIIHGLRLNQGQVMTTDNYQRIKQTLYKSAISEGYLESVWKTHIVAIDRENYTTAVILTLETGPRYTIGSIQFSQNPLSTAFLKRYLLFQEGDPYRLSVILQSQILLRNSGYFQQALIETPTEQSDSQIPLTISLIPAPKYYILFGLGLSTDLGVRAKIEGLVRHLNQQGHQIAGILQTAKTNLNGVARYTIPGRSPIRQQHHIQLECTGHYKDRYTQTSLYHLLDPLRQYLQIDNPTAVLSYLFTQQYSTWKLTSLISLHYERFKSTSTLPEKPYLGLLPGILISKTQTNWFRETHSYTLHIHAQWTTKPFSNIHLLKLESEGAYFGYLNQWLSSSYLILRGRYGSLFTPSLDDVPYSLRFYAGGYRYPRGYPEYPLGIHTLGGGLEIRKHLTSLFYLNPFVEMNYHTSYKMTHAKGSAGVGLCLWYPHIGHIEISGIIRINPDTSQKRYGIIAKISTELQ